MIRDRDERRPASRLRLTLASELGRDIDGAWWLRTVRTARELPELISTLKGRLGEITCPALIVHGTADVAIPIEKAEVLRDRIAGPTTLVPIDGGPHAANMTHAEPVNKAIVQFLAALD